MRGVVRGFKFVKCRGFYIAKYDCGGALLVPITVLWVNGDFRQVGSSTVRRVKRGADQNGIDRFQQTNMINGAHIHRVHRVNHPNILTGRISGNFVAQKYTALLRATSLKYRNADGNGDGARGCHVWPPWPSGSDTTGDYVPARAVAIPPQYEADLYIGYDPKADDSIAHWLAHIIRER